MASVYRPAGRRHFKVEFRNQHGRAQTVSPGMTDRRAAEQLGAKLEHDAQRIAAGLLPDYPALTGAYLGLADRSGRESDLAAVLAEYHADCERRRLRPPTRDNYRRVMRRLREEAGWETLADVTTEGVRRLLGRLARGRAPTTLNQYRAVLSAFLAWCVEGDRIAENPMRRVKAARADGHRPGRRRAFGEPELLRFLAAAGRRRDKYLVAAMTGLRRKEVSLVEKRDFDLAAGLWHCREEVDKEGRAWTLPLLRQLRPELARILLPLPEPTSRLFPHPGRKDTFLRDLRRAKIPETDGEGRRLRFHSLRYTFCTMLARRAPMQLVQQYMRHATLKQTADTYTDLGLTDLWADREALADVFNPTADPTHGPTTGEGPGRKAL